jgi:DNA modification methylase
MIIPKKILGDCRVTLLTLRERSVHCCITSIPYWGLRSYLPKGHPLKHLEIGCEETFELYLDHISEVFRAVHRVLRDDGTLWLNCGDAYASAWPCSRVNKMGEGSLDNGKRENRPSRLPMELKDKDLLMMPARVAMRLQADGWYLRSQIPWIKRNAMPESVTDRPAAAVEYVYLLSKSQRYFYDRFAVMQGVSANTHARLSQDTTNQIGSERAHAGGKTNGRMKAVGQSFAASQFPGSALRDENRRRAKTVLEAGSNKNNQSMDAALSKTVSSRNRRNSDWFMESWQGLMCDDDGEPLALVVNPKGTTIKHFASYPAKLVEPMIKASTSEKGCCAECGTGWTRQLGEKVILDGKSSGNKEWKFRDEHGGNADRQTHQGFGFPYDPSAVTTIAWQPGCECHGKFVKGKITIPARISKEAAGENWGADSNGEYLGLSTKDHRAHGVQDASDVKARIIRNATEDREVEALVYESELPLDKHRVEPCVVLDPFSGTGCTAMVATNLGRRSVSCELNPEYFKDSDCRDAQCGLALL